MHDKLKKAMEYYFSKGIKCFPVELERGKDGKKVAVNMHPWRKVPVTDLDQALKLLNGRHNGVAIITGEISNLTAYDIDVKDKTNGFAVMNENKLGQYLVDAPAVKSPSGGKHYYYQYEPHLATYNKIEDSIDIRSDGGLLFAPPSLVRGDTNPYIWDGKFKEAGKMPQPLIDFVKSHRQKEDEDIENQKDKIAHAYPLRDFDQLSPSQRKYIDEKLKNSDIEKGKGDRSKADFDLVCWCIRCGLPQDTIWAVVCDIGKFKTDGRRYFDTTYYKSINTVVKEESPMFPPIEDSSGEFVPNNEIEQSSSEALNKPNNILEVKYTIYSARDLQKMKLPPPAWAIPHFIPDGLSILCARPKAGKTYLALNIAYALAMQETILGWFDIGKQPKRSPVIFIGYETTTRGYQGRLRNMTRFTPDAKWPTNLQLIERDFPTCQENGIEYLRELVEVVTPPKLIVIDTLEKFLVRGGREGYTFDNQSMTPIYKIASEYNVPILCIHHSTKAAQEDPYDMISGSYGIEGNLDGEMILRTDEDKKTRLYTRGREFEETKYIVEFDRQYCAWNILGESDTYAKTSQQNEIVDLLKRHDMLTSKEIAEKLEANYGTIKTRISRMFKEGTIGKQDNLYHLMEFTV